MAGLGKTTLARKVFHEPSSVYHFHVRAWTIVTQVPRKRDLLLVLLKTGFEIKNINDNTSDVELSVMLKRRLSGQRYLIVLDDIWDIGAWNDLRMSFPDDNIGSRIIFTSRHADLPLRAQPGSYQHRLPFLTDEESWDLLQYKVFQQKSCPTWLVETGMHIAKRCQGLPLSVVVIAGILASDMTINWWNQVAQDLSSITVGEHLQTLVLSYNHLANHLKPCFLYFGAFPEDYEIPTRDLVLLWIAEGFVKDQTGENNNLEDIAADYLKDLINRSLVIVTERGSNGGIKTCMIHDLLRAICLKQAEEENFLHQLERYGKYASNFHGGTPSKCMEPRLYIHSFESFTRIKRKDFKKPFSQNVQSILCCGSGTGRPAYLAEYVATSFLIKILPLPVFKVLKVINLYYIELPSFPSELVELLNLRYIAIRTLNGNIPSSISNLQHLETLFAVLREEIIIPQTIWKMAKLRHLILKGYNNFKGSCFEELRSSDGYPKLLENLQIIYSLLQSKHAEEVLKRTPNLRKLGICGALYPSTRKLTIPNLDNISSLEHLSLFNNRDLGIGLRDLTIRELSSPDMFPTTLKKLTLRLTFLNWDEMQKIGMLPNLEVLKLQYGACHGERWEVNDGGFLKLKHLAFSAIDIAHWNATRKQFPKLQHLKLDKCEQLEEIPLDLGDIYTLEMIEVRDCNPTVAKSAHKIKEDQENKGNDFLKVSISKT